MTFNKFKRITFKYFYSKDNYGLNKRAFKRKLKYIRKPYHYFLLYFEFCSKTLKLSFYNNRFELLNGYRLNSSFRLDKCCDFLWKTREYKEYKETLNNDNI